MKTMVGLVALTVSVAASAQVDLGRWKQRWLNDYLTNPNCIWPNFRKQPAFNICMPEGYTAPREGSESGWRVVRYGGWGPDFHQVGEIMEIKWWQAGMGAELDALIAVEPAFDYEPIFNIGNKFNATARWQHLYSVRVRLGMQSLVVAPVLKKDAQAVANALLDVLNVADGAPTVCKPAGYWLRFTYNNGASHIDIAGLEFEPRVADSYYANLFGEMDRENNRIATVSLGDNPAFEIIRCIEYF